MLFRSEASTPKPSFPASFFIQLLQFMSLSTWPHHPRSRYQPTRTAPVSQRHLASSPREQVPANQDCLHAPKPAGVIQISQPSAFLPYLTYSFLGGPPSWLLPTGSRAPLCPFMDPGASPHAPPGVAKPSLLGKSEQ